MGRLSDKVNGPRPDLGYADYDVVASTDVEELRLVVVDYLDDGYEPVGGLTSALYPNEYGEPVVWLFQAVALPYGAVREGEERPTVEPHRAMAAAPCGVSAQKPADPEDEGEGPAHGPQPDDVPAAAPAAALRRLPKEGEDTRHVTVEEVLGITTAWPYTGQLAACVLGEGVDLPTAGDEDHQKFDRAVLYLANQAAERKLYDRADVAKFVAIRKLPITKPSEVQHALDEYQAQIDARQGVPAGVKPPTLPWPPGEN